MGVCLFRKSKLDSGILFGPWTPIYGIGVLIMLFIKRRVKRLNLNKFLELIIYFLIVTIVLTIIEQIGGMLLEFLFHKELWDYSNMKFHITKYIALEISLIWGGLSILIAYVIHPFLKKLIVKIPFIVFAIITILFSIDVILTIFKYI